MGDRLNSKQLLGQVMANYYREALEAKARGEKIGWSTSIAPQEFCTAMGLKLMYPENHSATIAAKKGAMDLLEVADRNDYSLDICSYARINLGYLEVQNSVAGQIPLPDFLICCNNICNLLIKWYENIAKELNIPLIMIDTPFNPEGDVDESRVQYLKEQFKEVISQLERITGRSFNYEGLSQAMIANNEAVKLWQKVGQYLEKTPAPFNGYDLYSYMSLMVCLRTHKEACDVLKLWIEELEANTAQGIGPYHDRPESYRILWDGIACWPHLSYVLKMLKSYGINVVGSAYPRAWALNYEINDLEGMARAYSMCTLNNTCLENQVKRRLEIMNNTKCDGAVYHINRSCKVMDFTKFEVQRRIFEQNGVPYVNFDGDQADPMAFSRAHFEIRLQALAEMMAGRKSAQEVQVGE